MAVTFKKQDDLEKMLEQFASFDLLEEVEFPDPKSRDKSVTNNKEDKK
ncbi:SPJ_0845 family protein [Streptococcus gallinaceus]|uniref:Type II restriction endonuclease DpnI n=1 Tax=Streptococcus gallinaceus TaxID=165758 RepID=A0ABV2JIH6_9STRE|nr:SPJ_0845 family protein [Streptococcus gallinaceus]MCP1638632.1 hypothetical protein [Streptococcus gallinaceus]MCP1769281.1 hypothetical protein [Streptococcus gallinaceus]